MSVVIETTIGDITVDLHLKERPNTCLNFLKLCKMKYYNLCLFHKVERNFIAQTGDPTATGRGGESIFSFLYGDQAKYFDAELKPRMKHEKIGTLSMVNNGGNMNGSQFFFTLGENLTYLDEVHTVFGEVAEGIEVLLKINEIICDQNNRPYQDIRITHTVILHDPYDDPAGLDVPAASPEPSKEMLETDYIAPDEELDDTKGKNIEEIEEKIKDSEAKARATILEMVGDIPDAEVRPPENVLFVCKLNPVTTSEDLELIFSRFGTIVSCEVIKDKKTGESLQYAFIEFEKEEDCENAYFKMDNVLIDDRRIHVDFSQSVAKLNWNQNKVGKGKPGRFQNFVLKSDAKKSDGYEMIFDMDDDNDHQRSRDRNRHQGRSRDTKSHPLSEESYKDKYSSRSRDVQVSESKHRNQKSKRSPSPLESSYYAKKHHSKSPRENPTNRDRSHLKSASNQSRIYHKSPPPRHSHHKSTSKQSSSHHKSSSRHSHSHHISPPTQSRFHDKSPSHSKSSDYQASKKASWQRSYSGSSSSPEVRDKAASYEERYCKGKQYQRSKPISHDKMKSFDHSSKHTSSKDNKYDYPSGRSKSPLPRNRKDQSLPSSEEDNYSKSSGSGNSKSQSSKSHSKSNKKSKQETASSSESSSSPDVYVSKKSSKRVGSPDIINSNEKPSKRLPRKRSQSPQYSEMSKKASSPRHKVKKSKHRKYNKHDSSSDDSDSYVSQSKLSKLKHSHKNRKRSSS